MSSREIPDRSWLHPGVVVRSSPIHGRGLFAVEPIARGEVLEILGGQELTDAAVKAAIDRGHRYDGIAIGPDLNLSIEPADWPGIHGNHSCDPNLWMANATTVEVLRPVAKDEELTVDYALFTAAPWWSMRCNCGAPNCRGVISGEDWRRPELQARYAGHFSPLISEKIRGLST
jgi:SET domain-containing protein